MTGDRNGGRSGWNEETLRRAFSSPPADAPRRSDCPNPEELADAAAGRLTAEATAAIVDHLIGCAACRVAWQVAHGAEAAAPAGRRSPDRRGLAFWRVLGALAAGVAIVIAGYTLRQDQDASSEDQRRGAPHDSIVAIEGNGVAAPRDTLRLRWSEVDQARYDVTLSLPSGRAIHESLPLDRAEYLVPEAALATVPAGATILWQVTVRRYDGTRLVSPTFSVTVR